MDWAALGANVDEPRPAFLNLTRTNRPLSAPASRGPQSTVAAIVRGFSFPDIDFNSERALTGAAAGCAPPNDRIQVSGGVVLRLSGEDRLAPPKNQPRPVGQLRANHHEIQASGMALASATKSLLRELAY
jgi:hypothetical protein